MGLLLGDAKYLPPTTRGGWEIFKRGSKEEVGKISKMIWGLPIEVGIEFLILGLVIADLRHSYRSKQAIQYLHFNN